MNVASKTRRALVIAGTDTGVGKTVVAAMLTLALHADYWKPVQAGGLEGESDTETVRKLTGFDDARMLPEAYRLSQPLSPHHAAELDGVSIDPARLQLPKCKRPLIIEAAGGLLVPLNEQLLFADLIASWQCPVTLCARTTLGTINHTLLSLEALRRRNCPVHGIVFIGDDMPDTQRTICAMGGAREFGRLPWLPALTPNSLTDAFQQNFKLADFLGTAANDKTAP